MTSDHYAILVSSRKVPPSSFHPSRALSNTFTPVLWHLRTGQLDQCSQRLHASCSNRELANEMKPQISELIQRAENGLETMKKRERLLRTRVEKRATLPSQAPLVAPSLGALESQLEALRQKKEALGKQVEGWSSNWPT
ncbi:hypothetical protein MVLG_04417 [Microbotryum lychnidis-dioicae p1A1 Lamole]|uniref:Outer kinetochore protein SPC19 n=2 Tax=Microbotryum lychnidis-dioicae (strain p1A1 Lamole / MvSl-1064) TaxID=683840 RepID=U5HB58_USTV1|nr:hypothetical protein MVLG_04417 [Microbotryum lychnidis-dioicae p1A1 Lamole]|eukprot:KDE05174.1 hypothetical protein MVLG_04417 [Microbotryum lychnidis-dioicae p1A1 Lamole]